MRYIKIVFISLILFSCKKDLPSDVSPEVLSNGILVLNEGLFQQNNSSVSWINLTNTEVMSDFFLSKNNRLLGDTGNDMKMYGNKIYIVLNGSNLIEVLDKSTGASLKQINMMNGNISKSPRSIVFHGSNAFVTCYDGYVDVLDTASLVITGRIQVGANPEDLAISNGKLYVSNSGGLNAPQMDSTVSVINLVDLQHVGKITVGLNPGRIITDAEGDLYVIARGNYGTIPARMVRINSLTDQKEETFSFDALGIEKMNEHFLITFYDYNSSQSAVRLFDPSSESLLANSFFLTSEVQTLYGISYDSVQNKIYCLDAMGFTNSGYVRRYSADGIYELSYHVGLNPSKMIIYE